MDDIVIARVVHLLAVLHWIGGVAFVTTIVLPAVAKLSEPSRRIAVFEEIEGRFSHQAKMSVVLAGLSGLYMTYRLDVWARFADPQFWWMDAMVGVWGVFAFVLFVAEPLFLHAWFRRQAQRNPDRAFARIRWAHWALLVASVVTVMGAFAGARGVAF